MEAQLTIARRHAIRLIAGGLLALPLRMSLTEQARAGREWCRVDPTFRVDDLIGNVYVAGEIDRQYDTAGPIQLRFTVPETTSVELLASDPGFGYGYDISYHFTEKLKKDHQKIEVEVEVFVPAFSDDLPIRVEFVPGDTVEIEDKQVGKTNTWIKVKTLLKKPKETREAKAARKAAEQAASETS